MSDNTTRLVRVCLRYNDSDEAVVLFKLLDDSIYNNLSDLSWVDVYFSGCRHYFPSGCGSIVGYSLQTLVRSPNTPCYSHNKVLFCDVVESSGKNVLFSFNYEKYCGYVISKLSDELCGVYTNVISEMVSSI